MVQENECCQAAGENEKRNGSDKTDKNKRECWICKSPWVKVQTDIDGQAELEAARKKKEKNIAQRVVMENAKQTRMRPMHAHKQLKSSKQKKHDN